MRARLALSLAMIALHFAAACAGERPDDFNGIDAGSTTRDGSSGASQTDRDGSAGGAGNAGDGASGCYREPYGKDVSLDDLATGYTPAAWRASSREAMMRRYATGAFILDQEKDDPALPDYADPSTWPNLMLSLSTMVHEETHGWDFASSAGGTHVYALRDDLFLSVPVLSGMWPRSEIFAFLEDDATSRYDATYLTGTQGGYDVVYLVEELNAYTSGLAAVTAVADQLAASLSARDAVAAHLYYLELYLRAGRTSHATAYAALKGSAEWQALVRYEWARGHFWDGEARGSTRLAVDADRIWAHVSEAANEDEIRQFTGADPTSVACAP